MSTDNLSTNGQDLLERFARTLARLLQDERRDALGRSVTVAELYQDIAPYRRMRELAGFEMHADYEHALIRFLAGEGGYARLDPESAADELGIEAESSDPDLSLYRKFAACDVRLVFGNRIATVAQPIEVEASPPPARHDPAPGPATAEDGDVSAAAPDEVAPHCGSCGHTLPTDREIRFCPFCGGDQTSRECASCGEALEEGWRFCIACGAAAEA